MPDIITFLKCPNVLEYVHVLLLYIAYTVIFSFKHFNTSKPKDITIFVILFHTSFFVFFHREK